MTLGDMLKTKLKDDNYTPFSDKNNSKLSHQTNNVNSNLMYYNSSFYNSLLTNNNTQLLNSNGNTYNNYCNNLEIDNNLSNTKNNIKREYSIENQIDSNKYIRCCRKLTPNDVNNDNKIYTSLSNIQIIDKENNYDIPNFNNTCLFGTPRKNLNFNNN